MIYAVTGEPGAGKSRKCVEMQINDLVTGQAFVVTNEILKLAQLRRYVCQLREKMGIEEPFDLDDNLLCLTPEMTFEFWRYRSGGLVLTGSPDREGDEEAKRRRMPKEQFLAFMEENFKQLLVKPEYQRPVHYYISETADFFDSQEWQTSGRAVKWYARKHRHLHDNVYFTAHNFDDVELRLRNLVSETIEMVNQTRMSIGIFKVRPVIKANYYFKMKTGGKTPFRSESSAIDVEGVCSCYNTAGAMAVHSTAEKTRNPGRLPWWSLYVAGFGVVALIALAFVSLPWLAGKGSAKILMSAANAAPVKAVTAGVDGIPSSLNKDAQPGSARGEASSEKSRSPARVIEIETLPLWVAGIAWGRNQVNVTLSDGRVLSEGDGILARVERNYVELVDGRRIYRMPGAGAKGAPERRDTEVPGVVIPLSTGRNPTAANESTRRSAQPSNSTPPPQQPGSWFVDTDGVTRLRVTPSLTSTIGR